MGTIIRERRRPAAVPVQDRLTTGPVVGTVIAIGPAGWPLVDFAGNGGSPLAARSLAVVDAALVGREVALAFEDGDRTRPIVLGVLQGPAHSAGETDTRVPVAAERSDDAARVDAEVDGQRVTLTAQKEIVLRCGEASITLTRAGKVLITGEYVLTRARGVNRVRGGSVQIN